MHSFLTQSVQLTLQSAQMAFLECVMCSISLTDQRKSTSHVFILKPKSVFASLSAVSQFEEEHAIDFSK